MISLYSAQWKRIMKLVEALLLYSVMKYSVKWLIKARIKVIYWLEWMSFWMLQHYFLPANGILPFGNFKSRLRIRSKMIWNFPCSIEPPAAAPTKETRKRKPEENEEDEEEEERKLREASGLTRSGRFFGGFINDIKRKAPWYMIHIYPRMLKLNLCHFPGISVISKMLCPCNLWLHSFSCTLLV